MPQSRPRVIVLALGQKPKIAKEAQRLRPLVEQVADIVLFDLEFQADLSKVEADFAIVMGGDGSILRAAHQMGYRQLPILGVNLGKLGFLADLSPGELLSVLPQVCSGHCKVSEHLMFECRVLRAGKVFKHMLGLNEVCILAGKPFCILDVNLYVDAELVTTYSCDGLIVATPIGSTAHSLSSGGPILRKDLQAFVFLPISPHTLSNRPVVDSAERVFELAVTEPHAGTAVVVDGLELCGLAAEDRVRVERAEPKFQLIEVPGRSYYRTLREKLGWGGRLRSDDKRSYDE
ncbi:MAG TPA: NAD(+)/NADH kinase [Pirellulales bacterium]|nr:NAD(+)/NADH kinase [Pirellulales bacterium]